MAAKSKLAYVEKIENGGIFREKGEKDSDIFVKEFKLLTQIPSTEFADCVIPPAWKEVWICSMVNGAPSGHRH